MIANTDELASAKARAIKHHIQAGHTLIHLRGKVPVDRNWNQAQYNPAFPSDERTGNYGVLLSRTMAVLDIDPRAFPPGDNPFERILRDVGFAPGKLPDTYIVKTGNNGAHLYFSIPSDSNLRTHCKKYPGAELKTVGSQVVGPGSIHPDTGEPYSVHRGSPEKVMQAPPLLLEIFASRGHKTRLGLTEPQDDPQTRQRFIDYLQSQAPLAVQGSGGDNTTFFIACQGKDYGLPESSALELMAEHWNPRCSPPWTDRALAQKVRNAYEYGQNEIGAKHPASVFTALSTDPTDNKGGYKPVVIVNLMPLPQQVEIILRALQAAQAEDPQIFIYGGQLVEVTRGKTYPLTVDRLNHIINRHVLLVNRTKKSDKPALKALDAGKDILVSPDESGFPELKGIYSHPILAPSGVFLVVQGYDSESGIYLTKGSSPIEI